MGSEMCIRDRNSNTTERIICVTVRLFHATHCFKLMFFQRHTPTWYARTHEIDEKHRYNSCINQTDISHTEVCSQLITYSVRWTGEVKNSKMLSLSMTTPLKKRRTTSNVFRVALVTKILAICLHRRPAVYSAI